MVTEGSFCPVKRSTAASSILRSLVRPCPFSAAPKVCTTAARSPSPKCRSMNRRAAARTSSEPWVLVCSSSSTMTYTRPSKGAALVFTSRGTGAGPSGSGRS